MQIYFLMCVCVCVCVCVCKVFGSKFECVWKENEDDNNGVQVGLKNEGLER